MLRWTDGNASRPRKSLTWLGLLLVGLVPAAASAESRRLCDVPMEWTYAQPAPDVPVKYQRLMGLWTGAVQFSGSSESTRMCIAVAIHDIKADGRTASTFAWNLGDGNESPNVVSVGQANWWAQSVTVFPEKGEQLIFASVAPYRGKWYRYVLDLPTAENPNKITGYLYATMEGSATDPSPKVWTNMVEAHKVTLLRQQDSPLPFAVPTN